MHVRASCYTTLFRVSLSGVGFRCVGLAQKISVCCKRASNMGSYVFSLFFFLILFSFLYYHICMFFLLPQRISLDLEVGYEKSILTRTKTLSAADCFKDPLLLNTLFLKRKYFYLLFIAIRT